jgi:hypothetical protein
MGSFRSVCCQILALASASLPILSGAQLDGTNRSAADTLLLHGRIYTSDPRNPWVEAIAIRADKIQAVVTGPIFCTKWSVR